MSQKNSIVIFPKLYDAGGEINKRWYIFYTYRDPKTGKNKRFKIYDGINDEHTDAKRRNVVKHLIEQWTDKLKNGYNPFEQEDVIYEDDLRYRKASAEYKSQKGKIRSIPYISSLFLQQKVNSTRLSTQHTYRSKLRRLKEFCEKNKIHDNDVAGFNAEHADAFVNYLFTEHKLGNKSVNEYITLMSNLWDYTNVLLSVQNRKVKNIWRDIKKFKTQTKKPKIYTMGQIRKLGKIVESQDKQMWLMIRLLFNCFIRPHELRYLKVHHVDLDQARIFIPAFISKNKKDSYVDIPSYIVEDMLEYGYDKYTQDNYLFSVTREPGPKPVSKNYFYKRFMKFRDEAGLPKDMIMYAMKHTGVAELKRSGADLIEIKNQLRHHSLDQVMEYCYNLLGQASEHIKNRGPQI